MIRNILWFALCLFVLAGCKTSETRITWDRSTLRKVSGGGRYSGYARAVQLKDGSLFTVYEQDGNVVAVSSRDLGVTWTEPRIIAARQDGVNMAVPDVLELRDGSILVCYNPRPFKIDGVRRFGIKTVKSYDSGLTWKDERLLYEAGTRFEDGCWEPSAVQLPSGEIRLFFANEGVFTQSAEQNISMVRSSDNGLTWTREPEVVSFRPGARDGMPVPLLSADKRDILIVIEDNGSGNFKPSIITSRVDDPGRQPAGADSPGRAYVLAEKLDPGVYAGAPYLARLSSGATLLSYQGTEGRAGNQMKFADMKVVIGDKNGHHFSRKTVPFEIPKDKSGLWNSITVLKGDTVLALTSTNGFSTDGSTEVWMILGHVTGQ